MMTKQWKKMTFSEAEMDAILTYVSANKNIKQCNSTLQDLDLFN